MRLSIFWDNPTRNLISRAEFGKVMSFKNKLGCKPATLNRQIEVTLPDKINMGWKRSLQRSIGKQFQMNSKATLYFYGLDIGRTAFVVSARNAKEFSNKAANGLLEKIGNIKEKNHIDNIKVIELLRK